MSNSGKVKCTCGWSWNKSDSSKKDMYICHECGRDNSNNMKNGGWLDNYADGGTMQEHQENYNDSEVSLPEGFVGMGNNTKGRDYSPAWGGQFQNGGPIKPSQKDYKTKGEYNAALKSYNVNLHKYELANNPERLKGESAKDYETRTKYFNFKIRQEQDKDPITKSYLEMKDDQETATNPIAKTLRQVFTSPAHVAHGIYNAANPKGLDKYKSRATKNDEDLDLVNSSLDAASLLIPFDSGMKADPLWKQAAIRTAKETIEDALFNVGKKANHFINSFQGGGSVYPVNYVPQAQNGEDVISWTKEYVKSPKYKERITNAGYNNPDEQIDRRLQNLENVNIVDTSNPRGTVYKPSKNTIETGYPEDLEYYNIHKNLYPTKPELNSIIAHELGHSETNRKGSATSLLNKRDREELKNRLRPGSDEDLEVYINGELKHDRSKHNIIPEENKSDLNSFRYDLRNMYDAGNEDFTEEYLKNSPDSFAKERLLKNYSPEDLIWLMNNVAQNKQSKEKTNVAQMGASIPGAVGFSYARTQSPAPSNGKYAKKTMASAQDGAKLDMYGAPITAIENHRYDIDRTYYDPRTNKMNLGYDYARSDNKNKIIAHENYHAKQHNESRDNFDIGHNTDNKQWAEMQKRPEMMSTPEVWNNFYNRKGIESDMMINRIAENIPESQFFRNAAGNIIYNKIVDPTQYKVPYSFEGEAQFYEDTGEEFKNGGWLNKYDVAQAGAQVEYGTPEYEESYNKGEVVTDEGGRSPILLDEVVVEGKPLTEFGKTRKEIAAKNTWEDYAQKYLGNFEKSMGQTLENLPESRKQEYEDYVNKLAFNEYIKTHPQAKGEKRGAYIDRMQAENANSSNFERAYEANADYNDATDVNKWRKGLIGLGSFVMGPGAINDLKQTSDYFSTKEKQDLIENPILSNIDTTLGTLEPLTIPVEGIYGNKSFGDIASGQSANIPMTARILGDPLMLGFEAAPLIGSGFRTAGRLLGTEEGLLSNTWKLNPRAYQYNLPENTMWRGLGKQGMEDAVSSGLFRSKQNVAAEFFPGSTLRMDKSFGTNPYFTPKFETASTYGDNFLAEVPRDAANWRNRYARTDWSQVADKPIPIDKGRLLQKDWWKGYQPIEVPIATESVAPKSWSMEELPGLHLQSTMDNGAISKIVEPKSGLINTEQALAIIGKESGGSDKVALIKQGLGETIPKKIDYNEFRKIVQDQLIPLDTQIVNHSSNYGISSLGYPSSKRSSFEMAIENLKQDLRKEIKILEETKAKGYEYTDIENNVNYLKERIAVTEASLKTLPLENKTFVFGNKENFGRGSSAHNNPKETLGHAHYLIDSETPDVLTVTQLQSDAFQGTHRMMPKSLEDAMVKLDDVKGNAKEVYKVFGDESEKFKDVLDNADEYLKLEKNHIKNFNQKILLDKNHQERYLQEIVANAAKRGDINKVRVPTSETAANVQGYVSQKHWNVNIKEGDEVVLLDGTKGKITDDTFDNITEITTSDGQKVNVNFTMLEFGKSKTLPVKSINNTELKEVTGYMPEHQTILKKYKEQPKLIKKLFGEEPTIVTDSKGNTWYEFEIPKNFKEGKGQIKAFKEGGIIKDDRGQWAYPGEVTEIGSNQITMQGVPYPVLGVSNTGDTQMMYPEEEYEFDGEKVTEYPIAQNGFDAKAFQKVLDEKFPRSWRNKKDINIRETNPVKKDNINVKKKNEIIIPTKKENAARSIQDQKQYMKDYMDSPMYNEMVDNSTTGISDKFFLNLSRDHNYDTAKVTLMNRNLTGEDKNVGANSNSTTGAIKVFPKGYQGPQLEGMISHEISHTIDKPVKWKDKARSIHEFLGNPYMDEKRIIPKKDIDLMQSYYKGNDYYKELFNKNALNNAALNEDREWFNYVSDPTETRARLNDIRYNAKKYNIYDPFTEKVDVEKLNEIRKLSKKAGGFDPFNQLRDVYSEDQIINMLNTISQNDTEEDRSVSVAKNGIRQEQKGLQNLDQLTNFTNYNTKQPGGWLEKFAVGGIVPGGTTPDESYDIKEGDTLFEIARDNNVPLNTLANTNKLTNPDLIKTGDKLVIPKKYKKELSFNEILTTDNKKIVIDNFSKHYDYIVEGDKTYYKVKSGNTWADISDNKEARANLLKFLDKNDYWKGYGSGEKAKFDKVNHEPVIVPGGKVPKTTPTVIRNTQTGNKPAIVKRPIAKVVKEEPGFFDEVSDFVSSGYESLQNKWKDVKEQTDLVKSVVEESVKLGVNTAIQTTEDAYHTLVNGIDRKFKTHTGEDNDVKIETKISQTPKTVKEWYGNTSGAEITQVIDAPNTDGRIYKQQVLPTSNIKFGVRNRGEYKDITTDGLEITTFNSFSKDPLPENTTVLAVDPGGNLHTGTYKDFKGKKDYLFSKTFRNNIIDFSEVNGKGQYISGQKSGNPKYQLPKIKVLDDNGKVVDGSLNILVKDDSKKDYYGQVQGGRVLFVNPDTKQQYLVSGTINHIKQKFKELKGNSKYLEAYTLDNGTYSRGLSYKDKKLTKNRLKSYDLENTGGGNGLYIIDYKQPVNKYEEDYIDNMPNIRTKNDTSYKKGHALKNEVKNIVLHHTAYTGPNAEKELNKQYMTKGNNSSHIVIQENGKRTIYASPEQVTFHAGESEWNKRKDVNDFSIGVEFQGDTNKKPLTQAQIESFVEYYATIAKKYNLSLKDIITHQMIAPGRKPDINEKQYARILKYMRDKKFK
jgi:LysM repeat protein